MKKTMIYLSDTCMATSTESALHIKQGRAPQEKRGGEGRVELVSASGSKLARRYLPSWGQLNFSDHLLLHKGSTPERPTVE